MEMRDENQVLLSGDIPAGFTFSHEEYGGRKMYVGYMNVFHNNATYDILPIIAPKYMVTKERELIASVYGELRSRTVRDEDGKCLEAYVRAIDIQYLDRLEEYDTNEVYLTGYLVKKPTVKKIGTSKDRLLARALLAVNRKQKSDGYMRSDAISCLFWEENAEVIRNLGKGDKIKISGRFQSRELWSEQRQEWVTALEVSVKNLEVL